jgi:hypothetical protein
MEIMRDTDIYVSAHDAGLLNLVFMKPHSAIVEVIICVAYSIVYHLSTTPPQQIKRP